jgi:hypothetical protein
MLLRPPFDLEDPPDDPPPGTRAPLLWQLAIRLYREHDADPRTRARRRGWGRCRLCGAPWPCVARRLSERGLVLAVLEGVA